MSEPGHVGVARVWATRYAIHLILSFKVSTNNMHNETITLLARDSYGYSFLGNFKQFVETEGCQMSLFIYSQK